MASKTETNNIKNNQFKSEFTKDADAAFDEFCRKYLNSSNGFFMPSEQSQTQSKNVNKPNQTLSVRQTTYEGFNKNQLFNDFKPKSGAQSNRHLSLDSLITTFDDFNNKYGNFKERVNRQTQANNLRNKSEQRIRFHSVTANTMKKHFLNNEQSLTASPTPYDKNRKSLIENLLIDQDQDEPKVKAKARLSYYNYNNTISINDFKKKNSLRTMNYNNNAIVQVPRPPTTEITNQAIQTSRVNTSIDYINKMNMNNIRLNEIKNQIKSLIEARRKIDTIPEEKVY
jgi:hypothetical protein